MAEDLNGFLDTQDQHERLRTALRKLIADGIRPIWIVKWAKANCDRGVINKFCKPDGTKRLRFETAKAIWEFLASHPNHRELLGLSARELSLALITGEDYFFHALIEYDDVHKHRTGARMQYMEGVYRFYRYSEEFNAYSPDLPCAIVVGEFTIALEDRGIAVTECQSYDGHLGKVPMTETSTGYCFPKGHEFFFIMKTAMRETPAFFVFYKVHIDGMPRRVQFMNGYMLKGSYDGAYFHSPIYVRRVNDSERASNILRPSEIPASILAELDNERHMVRATLGPSSPDHQATNCVGKFPAA